MATVSEQGLLGQILVEVKAVGAEVAAVRVDVSAVIADAKHRATQGDDHEARIRIIEQIVRDAVTQVDLDKLEEERAQTVRDALDLANKRSSRRAVWTGVILTAIFAAVSIVANVLTGQ